MKASRLFRNAPARGLFAGQWLLAILLLLSGNASVHAQSSASQFSRSDRIELERLISVDTQKTVNGMRRLDGQRMPTRIRAKFDDTGRNLLVELGRGFIPEGSEYIPPSMQLQHQYLDTSIRTLLEGIVEVEQIIFLYDGKNIFYYFPEESPVHKVSPETDVPRPGEEPGIPVGDTVVVSASHGLYRLYESDGSPNYTWEEQRPLVNGVREDYLTGEFNSDSQQGDWFPRETHRGVREILASFAVGC